MGASEEGCTGHYFPRNGGERCGTRSLPGERDRVGLVARADYRHARRRNLSSRWAVRLIVGREEVWPRRECNSSMTKTEGSARARAVTAVSSPAATVALRANAHRPALAAIRSPSTDLPTTCRSLELAAPAVQLTQREQEVFRLFSSSRAGERAVRRPDTCSSPRRHPDRRRSTAPPPRPSSRSHLGSRLGRGGPGAGPRRTSLDPS